MSAKAGLKNATKQAEDLRLQLRQSEENLVTEKQGVSDLKAELAKVRGGSSGQVGGRESSGNLL